MKTNILTIMAVVLAATIIFASPARSAESDLATGALNPYDQAQEKNLFLIAAGADNELTEKEFSANRETEKPFARKFDSFRAMLKYDKNKNTKISWMEADAYRTALGDEALAVFDKDKSGKIDAVERKALIALLESGKLPGKFSARSDGRRGRGDRGGRGGFGGRGMSPEQIKANDTDGDGKLSDEEIKAAYAKMREQWKKQQEESRKQYITKHDTDGDGTLSDAEKKVAEEAQRAKWRKRGEEAMNRRYDTDGDGKL
ncbi:MAG TPA: hypothetical protein ENL03_05965, partial [Phycisphaerae bacterium]|nr:hypothetical protein [Phycisphaerae bacterium]